MACGIAVSDELWGYRIVFSCCTHKLSDREYARTLTTNVYCAHSRENWAGTAYDGTPCENAWVNGSASKKNKRERTVPFRQTNVCSVQRVDGRHSSQQRAGKRLRVGGHWTETFDKASTQTKWYDVIRFTALVFRTKWGDAFVLPCTLMYR